MSGGLSDALELVTDKLESAGVAFMVAGSWASTYHGHPRTTQDVDVVIDGTRVIEVRGAELDRAYIERWLDELGVRNLWVQALEAAVP